MEKSIVFAAESEGDLKEWVKKLKVYLVQSELPSHLVMAQAMFQKTRTMVSGNQPAKLPGAARSCKCLCFERVPACLAWYWRPRSSIPVLRVAAYPFCA
eukprot:14471-Rhodomonas_salina.1